MKEPWSVAVVFEDTAARQEAVGFCDRLVERFWASCEFQASWWPFARLQEPGGAREALAQAASADLLVFALRPEGELPRAVSDWVELWLSRRGVREGKLVGLMASGEALSDAAVHKKLFLRKVAHRAGMDYLTDVPQTLAHHVPDSIESYSERAHQVTNVLDEILQNKATPPRLPI